jgi:hypothetical protein
LHVAKHSDTDTDPFAEPIREETLHSALEIANHQIDRSRFVTASESANPAGVGARHWIGADGCAVAVAHRGRGRP